MYKKRSRRAAVRGARLRLRPRPRQGPRAPELPRNGPGAARAAGAREAEPSPHRHAGPDPAGGCRWKGSAQGGCWGWGELMLFGACDLLGRGEMLHG